MGGMPTETSAVAFQALLVPQSWSLSLELMFYALAPWLARRTTRALLIIAGVSIALRIAGTWLPVDFGLWQGRFFPTTLFLFVFGMLAYRALGRAAGMPRQAHWGATAAIVCLLVFLPLSGIEDWVQHWIVYFAIAAATPFAFALTRTNRLDRWIGELSYPIYLTHLLVVAVVLIFEFPWPAWSAIAITLMVSILIMVGVEMPVDRWRQRRVDDARARRSVVLPGEASPDPV
jgi:peptidoglycan/LPS O-acetylase OafA/YrhL